MTSLLRLIMAVITAIHMVTRQIPQFLHDSPETQLMNWAGFSAKKEKTMLPPNFLVDPSQNCLIPDGDKVLPRYGTQTVFQGSNPVLSVGSIGGYTKYKNFAGIEMDIKAYRASVVGEQVYALFNNVYVPITINPNTTLNGTGRIYFSTYNDTDLDLSRSKGLSRLCWVNGYKTNDAVPKGRVFSWTGGISTISTIVGSVITIPAGKTFRQLGFTENFPNATQVHVTINGVNYFSTNVAQLDTNSLTLNASPTAVPGDIVTSSVEVDELVAPMDMLRQNKNYMYYGNELYRQWWMSNQFGRPAVTRKTESNAVLDDLVVDPDSPYTGSGRKIYKITITSTHPAFIEQRFSSPRGGTNEGFWDFAGYTGTGRNTYRIQVVSDMILTRQVGTQIGIFTPGEVIVGGTSGAKATLLPGVDVANMIGADVALLDPAIPLQTGEVITGETSGASMTLNQAQPQNTVVFFKQTGVDGALQSYVPTGVAWQSTTYSYLLAGFSGSLIRAVDMDDGIVFNAPYDNVNDVVATYTYQVGDIIELEVQLEEPDEFNWQVNNGTLQPTQNVSTSYIALSNGVRVKWLETTGHSVGDYWLIEVNQLVARPWANFYYTIDFTSQQPLRRPGEGYVYSLPANFWTMDTFEDSMYVNTSNGEWGYSSPILSADLLSEDISFTPLKQVIASKALYPYLTGHNRNDLIFIDESKNLTSIGRIQLMQKVQMENISNFVLNKFQELSFVNGSIKFQDNATWITSPEDNVMLCFNERTRYWQPPQVIPNLGILTVIGTMLYTHSDLNTATRSLNDPTAEGDDGVEYEVVIRSSTYDHGNRWNKKVSNTGYWEGYVDEAPPMKMKAYFDVDGCSGIEETDIIPVFCTDVVNNGVFGGGQDGGHEFGGDVTHRTNYARYNWDKLGVHHYYFSSLEFRCRAKRHPYQTLSMGLNLAQSKYNNKDYRAPESSIDTLLPLKN